MAIPRSFTLYGFDGLPKSDAEPEFLVYATKAGVARTPPEIINLGGGQYSYTPSDVDVQTGVVLLIDDGADVVPRYQSDAIFDELEPFALFVPFDENGIWSSGAPTVGRYTDFDGTARTPPAVVQAGIDELFTITPSDADLLVGIIFRLDAPTNVLPTYLPGSFAPSEDTTIKDQVILIAPELNSDLIPDALWSLVIGWAYDEISKGLYSQERRDRMAIYLVAHMLTLWLGAKKSGGGIPVGINSGVTVGKVSTTFAVPTFGPNTFTTASLRTTWYGLEYLRLLRVLMGGSATVAGGLGPLQGVYGGGFVI